jgi:iron complex transport system substrate-binding protein
MKRAWLIAITVFAHTAHSAPSVRDDYGEEVALEAPARRIVSLAPHLTELAYAAGAGGALVGAVDYSDYPDAARALPRVGSGAGVDIEAILALEPDLVLAWPSSGSARAVARLAALRVPVFRSEPRRLEEIPTTIERLGVLAGSTSVAARAASEFRARAARIEARYARRPKVRVFYQAWDRPLLTVNGEHLISRIIELCGGENVFAPLPQLAPQVDRESVLRADPDAIIASGAGAGDAPGLDAWRDMKGLAAARGHLYAVAPDLLQRHTPRVLDGAERVCSLLERVRAERRPAETRTLRPHP